MYVRTLVIQRGSEEEGKIYVISLFWIFLHINYGAEIPYERLLLFCFEHPLHLTCLLTVRPLGSLKFALLI